MVITFWTESKYNIAFCHLLSNSISLPEPQTPPSSHTAQSEQESGKWPAVETDPIWPACGNHWLCKLSHLHWNEHQNEFCTVGGRHLSQLQLQNGTLMYNNWILPSTDWRILQASSIPRDKGSSCNDQLDKRSANQGSGIPWGKLARKLYHSNLPFLRMDKESAYGKTTSPNTPSHHCPKYSQVSKSWRRANLALSESSGHFQNY